MFKSIAIIALFYLAAASAGVIETHHVLQEPVLTKIGSVVHSSPSAVSHQSFTQVHNKAVVSPVLAPVVKTTLHAAPIVKTIEPVVHTYAAAPAVHNYAAEHVSYSAPLVHSGPIVHSSPIAHSSQILHSSPIVHSSSPIVHSSSPILHSSSLLHSAPVVHSAPLVHSAPATYTIHH